MSGASGRSVRVGNDPASATDRLTAVVALIACLWFGAAYLPGIGRGFIKDDFAWIARSAVSGPIDAAHLFLTNTGFYRPIVSLSFAADYALFDLQPVAYGLTNLLLLLLTAVAIARLAAVLRLPPLAGVVAASIWALNPHGISMALLWMSGRTSLLLTLFGVLGAVALVRGRSWIAACWVLLAMLSKEEAVLLPAVFLAWAIVLPERSRAARARVSAVSRAWPVFVPLAVYAVLRAQSGAMTPGTAPAHYRFLTAAGPVLVNALHYLDRTSTFPVAIALLATLAARRLPVMDAARRRAIALGLTWLVGGCALTVLIPSRSSLYAVFPSVGSALIAAAWLTGLVREGEAVRVRPIVAATVALALIGVPVYHARNRRWLASASVSGAVMPQLERIGSTLPNDGTLQIVDRSGGRTIEGAFGTLLGDALNLAARRTDLRVWLEPPANDWALAGWQRPGPATNLTVYEFTDGRLVPAH